MNHEANLAAYCTRRAAAALAAGNTAKAAELEALAAHWNKEARR